ncbi:MAG: hypothetical protein OXH59_02505 [Rhodospirillaceae bacterium]|nr:hypothetical protein [Rhodospirillaceae bacterium]
MDLGEDAAMRLGPVAKQPTRFVVEGVPKGLQGLLGADGVASGSACAICHPAPNKWNRRALAVLVHQPALARQTLHSLVIGINLIGSSTTGTGLKVCCDLEPNEYPTDVKTRPE